MKPTITGIGAGLDGQGKPIQIAADPRFGGAQSITVTGSGLANADLAIAVGPTYPGWEPLAVFSVTDSSLLILPRLPLRGQYALVIATKDLQLSDVFTFQVL